MVSSSSSRGRSRHQRCTTMPARRAAARRRRAARTARCGRAATRRRRRAAATSAFASIPADEHRAGQRAGLAEHERACGPQRRDGCGRSARRGPCAPASRRGAGPPPRKSMTASADPAGRRARGCRRTRPSAAAATRPPSMTSPASTSVVDADAGVWSHWCSHPGTGAHARSVEVGREASSRSATGVCRRPPLPRASVALGVGVEPTARGRRHARAARGCGSVSRASSLTTSRGPPGVPYWMRSRSSVLAPQRISRVRPWLGLDAVQLAEQRVGRQRRAADGDGVEVGRLLGPADRVGLDDRRTRR